MAAGGVASAIPKTGSTRDVLAPIHSGPATPALRRYLRRKRLLDLVVVVALAPVALPVMAVLALAIRLDSRGSAIFTQERIGTRYVERDGEAYWELCRFSFFKLRTMHKSVDAEPHREYLAAYIEADEQKMAELQPDRPADSYKMACDARITRVGAVLRRLSLDELPQLWNIARGDFSVIGPRPPLEYEVEKYTEDARRRLAGPLGLSGWWQVNGRSDLTFQEMVDLDTEYLAKRSVRFDMRIMARSVGAVLSGKGAG